MRLPSLFNDQRCKDLFKDEEQQIAVKEDPKQFQVSLDTSLYRPDELKINVVNGQLTVEANHEEKAEDGSKLVSRRFVRKYTLPQGCQDETVTSNLSSDGVLMITAPKLALEEQKPIQQEYDYITCMENKVSRQFLGSIIIIPTVGWGSSPACTRVGEQSD